MALLLGNKVYIAKNNSIGSSENDADFTIYDDMYPYYYNQSYYDYPNLNISFFGENIFYLNNKISITPGFRFEHINTQSDGQYRYIYKDLALNPIFDTITRILEPLFFLELEYHIKQIKKMNFIVIYLKTTDQLHLLI